MILTLLYIGLSASLYATLAKSAQPVGVPAMEAEIFLLPFVTEDEQAA